MKPSRLLRLAVVVVLSGALAVGTIAAVDQAAPFKAGDLLPAWSPGTLDIHQIVTGRGNANFMMFPDGTTALVDAGDQGETEFASQRPDASRTPAQWIARYIRHMQHRVDPSVQPKLDFAVLTHFHPDHMGRIDGKEPASQLGDYKLRGITEVAEEIPVARLIDRGWPDYAYLPPPQDAMFQNYRQFVDAQTRTGRLQMVGAKAGSVSQLVPVRRPAAAPSFEARIIGVNDQIWTGTGDASRTRFPALDTINIPEDRPTENMCSVTIRLKYGRFDYFTGGDIPGYPVPGAPPWHDVETDIAKVIGPTDVHVVNHHGSIEEENLFWLATLKSRVMIVPAWSATHPSPDVLKRILSRRVYPDARDIFITVFRPETQAAIGARATQVASSHGHVVVRVEPGGARYWVLVLDDTAETYKILSVHGPYAAE
jgi:beta-lactamase superfamily II metal-dependent hydrolase